MHEFSDTAETRRADLLTVTKLILNAAICLIFVRQASTHWQTQFQSLTNFNRPHPSICFPWFMLGNRNLTVVKRKRVYQIEGGRYG